SPSLMLCAADTTACKPEPHRRLTVSAGVSTGMPASTAATRETYMSRGSVCTTWPNTTWPMSAGATEARRTASAVTRLASSDRDMSFRLPPNTDRREDGRNTIDFIHAASPDRQSVDQDIRRQ